MLPLAHPRKLVPFCPLWIAIFPLLGKFQRIIFDDRWYVHHASSGSCMLFLCFTKSTCATKFSLASQKASGVLLLLPTTMHLYSWSRDSSCLYWRVVGTLVPFWFRRRLVQRSRISLRCAWGECSLRCSLVSNPVIWLVAGVRKIYWSSQILR